MTCDDEKKLRQKSTGRLKLCDSTIYEHQHALTEGLHQQK